MSPVDRRGLECDPDVRLDRGRQANSAPADSTDTDSSFNLPDAIYDSAGHAGTVGVSALIRIRGRAILPPRLRRLSALPVRDAGNFCWFNSETVGRPPLGSVHPAVSP